MAYPSTIDSFSTKNTGEVIQGSHINDLQTAVVSLETKVGITGSAVTGTLDYQVTNTASSDPGHKHTLSSLSDFTITSAASGDILRYSGTKWTNQANLFKFGGTGTDGALNITSGTTTIDCANAAVVVKNYTSISITNTGALAFSNPNTNGTLIILKSQGNVTLTSSATPMIDVRLMGGAVSTSGLASYFATGGGGTGVATSGTTTAGTAATVTYSQLSSTYQLFKYPFFFVGGGSGNGAQRTGGVAGVGKKGGGGLIIECYGAFNFTTASGISVAGTNGGNASGSGAGTAGGGGGSGGGFCGIWYNTLTANSGTITVSAGTGGTAYTSADTTTSDGGGGGGGLGAGGGGAIGTNQSGRVGYNGGDGLSLVIKNIDFA